MINKILVAVNQMSHNESVFDTAVSLAKTTGADLMLLHVMSPKEPEYPILPIDTYYPLVEDMDYEQYDQQFAAYEQRGLEFLRDLAQKAIAAGVETEYTQLSGTSGRVICELASSWAADLILVGSRGLRGLKEMFLGSVSNYVTHHAPCSVLIVRADTDSTSDTDSVAKQEEMTTNC